MVTFKIKENSKQAKAVIEFLKTCDFVEIIANNPKGPQSLDKLIQDSEKEIKQGKTKRVNAKNVWESIGLK